MVTTEMISTKRRLNTVDMVYIAIGAALMAICSWISIPAAVPFTLQTFAVFTILALLGGRRGTLSILVYLLIGLIGAPVFAGFTGGPGVLFGSTGGYLIGFLLTGVLYDFAVKVFKKTLLVEVISLVIGLFACYALGTAWFMVVYARNSGAIGIMTALGWCVFPFVIPDLIKLALGFIVAKRVRPVIH